MEPLSVMMFLLPNIWPLFVNAIWQQAIPTAMRPGLFFGVTVDPRFRESELGRAIRRRYSLVVWTATLIAAAILTTAVFAASGVFHGPAALTALVVDRRLQPLPWILQLAVALWAYVRGNRATRPHAMQPSSVIKVDLSAKPAAISPTLVLLVLPIASLAVLAVWTATHWRDLPARFAVHWAFGGPDRWVATTPAHVATWFSFDMIVCLVLALVTLGVLQGSRRIMTAGEAGLRELRFRRRVVSLLIAAEYFSVFPVWAGLLGLPSAAMKLWQLVFPATMLVLLARLLLVGQGGTRGLSVSNTVVGDRTADRHWTWGLLYFNRADPAFLVEKRFGVGYTFNLAHPFAWALLALIAVIPLIGKLL